MHQATFRVIMRRCPRFGSSCKSKPTRRRTPYQTNPSTYSTEFWPGIRDFSNTLSASLEFEPTDVAAADHALIVDDVAADDFGHHGQIEVTDFRIALGETVKHTICRFDRGQFLVCHSDRPRLVA